MKIAATLHCAEYRGDHSADIEIALDVKPEDTLAEVLRLATEASRDSYHETLYRSDRIVLQLVQEREAGK